MVNNNMTSYLLSTLTYLRLFCFFLFVCFCFHLDYVNVYVTGKYYCTLVSNFLQGGLGIIHKMFDITITFRFTFTTMAGLCDCKTFHLLSLDVIIDVYSNSTTRIIFRTIMEFMIM